MTSLAKPHTDEERARHSRLRARMGASESDYPVESQAQRPAGLTAGTKAFLFGKKSKTGGGENFNPNQPRDEDGRWVRSGGGSDSTISGPVVQGDQVFAAATRVSSLLGRENLDHVPISDPRVEARSAIRAYQTETFSGLNRNLRLSSNRLSHVERMTSQQLRKILANNSPLSQNVLVYRGIANPDVMFDGAWNREGDNTGLTWRDPGFVSTSAKSEIAEGFDASQYDKSTEIETVVMEMTVPAGTRALAIDAGDQRLVHEQELLLDTGYVYRIVGDDGPSTSGPRRIRVVVEPEGAR